MGKKRYFKLIVFSFIFILANSSLFAFDWGIINTYENTYQDFAVLKLIKNQPIKYFIQQKNIEEPPTVVDQDKQALLGALNKQLNQEQKNNRLKTLITRAFNVWPRDTKNNIEWAKREQEFADIMPYLSRKVVLQEVFTKEEADIIFRFDSKENIQDECGDDSLGCFLPYDKTILVPVFYVKNAVKQEAAAEEKTYYILIHEIGHYFALTDQYENTGFDSLEHSTFNRINTRDAVMGSSHNLALYCDDVDGFINVIDLTLSLINKGKFSARAKKGWASFCNGKTNGRGEKFADEYYKEAKLTNKPDYISDFNLYKYDENGNVALKHFMDPFDFVGKSVRLNDKGLPYVMFDDENKIRYTYDYNKLKEGTLKIDVLRNNEYYTSFRYEKMAGEDNSYHWINIKQEYSEIMINISADKCFITEDLEPIPNKSLDILTTTFDKANNLISTSYEALATDNNPSGIRKLIPFTVSRKDNICSLEIDNKNILKLQIEDKGPGKIIYQDQQTINNLLDRNNISKKTLVEEMLSLCKKQAAPSLIEKNSTKCKYFRDIDNLLRY